jgi:hypothetical protein
MFDNEEIIKNLYLAAEFSRQARPWWVPKFIWKFYKPYRKTTIYLVAVLPIEVVYDEKEKKMCNLMVGVPIKYYRFLNKLFSSPKKLSVVFAENPELKTDDYFNNFILKFINQYKRVLTNINTEKKFKGRGILTAKIYENHPSANQQTEAVNVQPKEVGTQGN